MEKVRGHVKCYYTQNERERDLTNSLFIRSQIVAKLSSTKVVHCRINKLACNY